MQTTNRHADELTVIETEPRSAGIAIPAPKNPIEAARWRTGVAARKAAGLGTQVGDE